MRYAHVFRRDGVNHTVVSMRQKIRRNGRHYTVCAKRIDYTFQRRTPQHGIPLVIECDPCLNYVIALTDIFEQHGC